MAPSILSLSLVENQYNTWVYRRDDITSVTSWDADAEFRYTQEPTGTAALALSLGSGITMTADGAGLAVGITLTEAQSDALVAGKSENDDFVWHSLKLTNASGVTEQQYIAQHTVVRTPTT